MGELTKTTTILEIPVGWKKGSHSQQQFFRHPAPEEEGEVIVWHELQLDKRVWEEMGRPEKITVTIEPGDKLNEEVHDV